jgi:hypothetical protein
VVLVGVHPEKSEVLRHDGVRIVQADGDTGTILTRRRIRRGCHRWIW